MSPIPIQMTGSIEKVLTARYGHPTVCHRIPFIECSWDNGDAQCQSRLYKSIEPLSASSIGRNDVLESLYGDAIGGFLVGSSLKVANLSDVSIFGLYQIADLLRVAAVRRAQTRDPEIWFFMDSANVWYYGVKRNELWVYDEPFDELDSLGEFSSGLNQLLQQWEDA